MTETYAFIKEECMKATTTDPVALAFAIMGSDQIRIHGPEHHILDGSCFLAALHNAGVEFDLSKALDEMAVRGSKMPGATCGQWGVCGSASSIGAALSILHGTGPLSGGEYYKDNLRYTSRALGRLAEIGGPRCCKRNAFLSMGEAVDFVKERYGIELPKREIVCEFSGKNQQCIQNACPFYPGKRKAKVAFVCVHNSCRSQIAEALGKSLASDVFECYSAGTETKPRINPDAVRMMKALHGIDMEKTQYSKLLSDIPPVDIVVTMGCNVDCPNLPCRHREDWGLEDPSGKSDAEFAYTIRKIEEKVLDLKARFGA